MAGRNTSPTSTSSATSSDTAHSRKGPASRSSSAASPPMSTPPTSLGDESSVLSDTAKMESHTEPVVDRPETPAVSEDQNTPRPTPDVAPSEGRRSVRSSRASVTTYNVQILAGTAIHTPTKYLEKHHKNVLHGSLEDLVKTPPATPPPRRRSVKRTTEEIKDPAEAQLATEVAQAAQRRRSSRVDLRKEAIRNLTAAGEAVAQKGPELLSSVKDSVQNVLRGSFGKSKGKSAATRAQDAGSENHEENAAEDEEEKEYLKPKVKQWEKQGLYVGQHRDFKPNLKESKNRKNRRRADTGERQYLPLPMFAGERMLNVDYMRDWRDFKLPFDVYSPLPKKIKVDGWVQLRKNRFVGDASALWKKDKQDASQCNCSPEDGCGEFCHNRIMSYECDEVNCNLTPEQCGNRPFAQLKRRAKGNRYDYGVEVMKTGDKGYGVRAMRTFEPHQIIVEYAGEIITQQECERRMKQIYKKDKCYYLMSFDNKMIIDATRGTIARFVNHSCEPNCEMIKWTVGGEPRMALFAGPRGIMTGEELTYDYNFDPFSLKNQQVCRCGTRSCRGVLGPKPKHQPKEDRNIAASIFAGTKRKLQEVFSSGSGTREDSAPESPKKRKLSGMGSAALTKKENALARDTAAQEKAKKEAEEQAAQRASRENRALRRSTSAVLSSRRTKTAGRHSLPATISKRKTIMNFKRGTPKSLPRPRPGALKATRRSLGSSSLLSRSAPSSKSKATAARSPSPGNEDELDINITPASLRSAARKMKQTTLPFKKLDLGASSSKSSRDTFEVPDSEEEEMELSAPTSKRVKATLGKAAPTISKKNSRKSADKFRVNKRTTPAKRTSARNM